MNFDCLKILKPTKNRLITTLIVIIVNFAFHLIPELLSTNLRAPFYFSIRWVFDLPYTLLDLVLGAAKANFIFEHTWYGYLLYFSIFLVWMYCLALIILYFKPIPKPKRYVKVNK